MHSTAIRAGLALSALCAAGLTLGCQNFPGRSRIEVPEVSVTNVAPLGLDGFESRARVDLRLSNPNEFPLEIEGLRFALDLNGRRFARGQSDQVVSIPRFGDARVSVEVTSGLGDLLRQLGGLSQPGGDPDFSYRISGDLFLAEPEERVLPFRYTSQDD